MQKFHISATGHSVNYLPEYVANWRGFFTEEGLAVSADVPNPWDIVLADLASGKANAALGGIWVPAMHFGRGVRYTPFAQVSSRAPLALVGRERAEDFRWANTQGRVISMKGSNGASVGIFTKLLLKENGVDPHAVGFIQDLDGALLTRSFVGGMGDYLVIDLPSALALEAAGGGHVVVRFAVDGGAVPWSVYYGQGEPDSDQLDAQKRFVRALAQGMDWILDHSAEQFRDFLAKTFPRFHPDMLVGLVDLYRANGMWTTPQIDRPAYDRWQQGIADGFLTAGPIAYADLVDSRPTADLTAA